MSNTAKMRNDFGFPQLNAPDNSKSRSWVNPAACHKTGNPKMWDLIIDGEPLCDRMNRHLEAVRICTTCPVKQQCATALEAEQFRIAELRNSGVEGLCGPEGVWAGHLYEDGLRKPLPSLRGATPDKVRHAGNCTQCGCLMVTGRTRPVDMPYSSRKHAAHGTCEHCYGQARRSGLSEGAAA
jgi:hypothetical protein